jgi:hypothetical protein
MWREIISMVEPKAIFFIGATESQVVAFERAIHVTLPDDLKNLLQESNGVRGEFGLRLIWSIEETSQHNLEMRHNLPFISDYMSFDHLVFFADAGNGDRFAFGIIQGAVKRPDIFVWDHENDSRSWVAPSLRHYLDWWLTGKLNI